MRRPILLLLLLTLGSASATQRPDEADESILVERAHWPVLVRPTTPGAATRCAELGPADVEVLRDGAPLTVVAVGPRPLPRLHALLIDTSNSMLDRLDEARQAAQDYIEALPPDDRVLVASFDENLWLATPPILDRARAARAVERVELGYYTALWDAVYYLVRYLETLPEEKILVLLSDGEDSSSMKAHRFDRVLELAAQTPNLMVFPIGIDLPERVWRSVTSASAMARGRLGQIAEQTGGELFEIEYATQLSRFLGRVRERLGARVYVSYVPALAPDGSDPATRGAGRLRIRARAGVPCRVVALGAPGRYERRVIGASGDLRRTPAAGPATPRASECLGLEPPPRARAALRLAGAGEADDLPLLWALDDERALLGRARDIATESGPLFRAKAYLEAGKLRVAGTRKPVFEIRDIAVITPPLDRVLELEGPQALLLWMLESGLCATRPALDGSERPPFLVHGQTFLELRELVGRALFHERADLREWARQTVRRDVRRGFETLVADLPEDERPSAERLHALERALLEQAADPQRGRAHVALAEWLGDVDIVDAAVELERELADGLLRGRTGAAERAARVVARWNTLERWFPPAIHARILVPLVPVHDAARGVLGFYRFLLPRPDMLGQRPATLPPRPAALGLVRELVERIDARALRAASPRITSIAYGPARARELPARSCAARPEHKVALGIESASAGGGEGRLTLELYFDEAGEQPPCYRVLLDPGASPELAELARALERGLAATPDGAAPAAEPR